MRALLLLSVLLSSGCWRTESHSETTGKTETTLAEKTVTVEQTVVDGQVVELRTVTTRQSLTKEQALVETTKNENKTINPPDMGGVLSALGLPPGVTAAAAGVLAFLGRNKIAQGIGKLTGRNPPPPDPVPRDDKARRRKEDED